jgi:hypothetical protein
MVEVALLAPWETRIDAHDRGHIAAFERDVRSAGEEGEKNPPARPAR